MAFSLSKMFRRAEQRKTFADLMALDDHMLRDIGFNRGDLQQLLRRRSRSIRTHE